MLLRSLLLLPAAVRTAIAYASLSNDTLKSLPSPGTDFDIHTGALLSPILIPRVPGTPGQLIVLQHFVDFFSHHLPKWKLSYQNSTWTTPTSDGTYLPFYNLIATRDPPWAQDGNVGRLALVAHYDSKLTPDGFIGATDSAAPCAMLLHAARSLDAALTKKWEKMEAEGLGSGGFEGVEEHKGVQVLLLDGEEAFAHWTDTDSLYGARALAEEWENTGYSAMGSYRTPIDSIDLFVLLDLLGSKGPIVPSYFKTTHWAYQKMADVESRLRNLQMMKSSPNHASKRTTSASNKEAKARGNKARKEPVFLNEASKKDSDRWIGGFVGDDHVPFMARGVEVLHLITSPFPRVWHTVDDNGEHLDADTVEDWAMLATAFAAEWMELEGFFDSRATGREADGRETNGRETNGHARGEYREEDRTELNVDP